MNAGRIAITAVSIAFVAVLVAIVPVPVAATGGFTHPGAVAEIFAQTGVIALTAFISPYRVDRDKVRNTLKQGKFIEVFVDAPLAVCEERDPKGLYKKARAGIIPEFTGISAPYEAPENAEIVLNTGDESVEQSAARVVAYLEQKGYVQK